MGSSDVNGYVAWDDDFSGENDECGDVFFNSGGGNIDNFHFRNGMIELTCADVNSDGYLDFNICFTWRTSSTDDTCEPYMLSPGSDNKCDCAAYDIPEIQVRKLTTYTTCA
jgi:hypothetical protein